MHFKQLIRAVLVSVAMPQTQTIPAAANPNAVITNIVVENGKTITSFTSFKVVGATILPPSPTNAPVPSKGVNSPNLTVQPAVVPTTIPIGSQPLPAPAIGVNDKELAQANTSNSILASSFPLIAIIIAATVALLGACIYIRKRKQDGSPSLINFKDRMSQMIRPISLKSVDKDVYKERPSFDRPPTSQSRPPRQQFQESPIFNGPSTSQSRPPRQQFRLPRFQQPQHRQRYHQPQKMHQQVYQQYNDQRRPSYASSQFSDNSQYHRSVSQTYEQGGYYQQQ
jgi:hypothetical protein